MRGKIFILMIVALPNQEKCDLVNFFKSSIILQKC